MSKQRNRDLRPAVMAAGLMFATGLAASSPALAEVIVIGGSAGSLSPGTVLSDAKTIDLPAGARVRVMLPSGRTQELKGPTKVKVGDLGRGEARNESLWNDVKRLVGKQKVASESAVGAARSVAPGKSNTLSRGAPGAGLGRASAFSWRRVPIDDDGDICVEKGAPLELLRGAAGRPIQVTVVDMQAKKRASAEFPVGAATTAWPSALAANVGRYTVVLPDGGKHEIRLRPIAPLPDADDTIRLLHSQRCLGQVETWLQGQLLAGR